MAFLLTLQTLGGNWIWGDRCISATTVKVEQYGYRTGSISRLFSISSLTHVKTYFCQSEPEKNLDWYLLDLLSSNSGLFQIKA